MRKVLKRAAALALALPLLLGAAGCGGGNRAVKPTNELTICMDALEYAQRSEILTAYAQQNPEVKISYEILPDASVPNFKAEDREIAVSRLRAALMAGGGPDLYIMYARKLSLSGCFRLFPKPQHGNEKRRFLRSSAAF
jgi:ABC-type glycerol-3-phosphate transport system substrate-binding protein